MSVAVTVRDEAAGGSPVSWTLALPEERLTAREIIRSRVYQEVQDFHASRQERFRGLIQPTDEERTLNGLRVAARPQIDWRKQFDRAVEVFQTGGFILLVDDRQIESLESEVVLNSKSTITFLKLMPLVGG